MLLQHVTEEIGQNQAFDVSHLVEIAIQTNGNKTMQNIWLNKPLHFKHGLAIAAAEAIARDIECVLWEKNRTYAWR